MIFFNISFSFSRLTILKWQISGKKNWFTKKRYQKFNKIASKPMYNPNFRVYIKTNYALMHVTYNGIRLDTSFSDNGVHVRLEFIKMNPFFKNFCKFFIWKNKKLLMRIFYKQVPCITINVYSSIRQNVNLTLIGFLFSLYCVSTKLTRLL